MSRNIALTGTLQMLHSLYDFEATYAKTLSFRKNEYFILHQTNIKHKNWWEVINETGDLGFIPSNYVETVSVNPSFYLQFVETCLASLRGRNSVGDAASHLDLMDYLNDAKRQVEKFPAASRLAAQDGDIKTLFSNMLLHDKNLRSSASSHSSLLTELDNTSIEEPVKPIQKINKEQVRKAIENTHEEVTLEVFNDTNKSDASSPAITQQSVYELVETVRINTQLSHELSRVAVVTVVQGLHEHLPASVFPYLSTIVSQVQKPLNVDNEQIEQTHDASRLKIIFTEITSCKEDSQQRSWMLHEDEPVITDYLGELVSILSNADASISRHVISLDQYHYVITLIQFYQMETRWPIRHLLLQTFGVLCSLDRMVVSIMLNSILPGELARDMMANPRNIVKLNYSSILFTMIFSMGEAMPVTHSDLLGPDFLDFLLNNIEYPPDSDIDDQIPDLFLNCILSFNLQFENATENPFLKAIEQRDVAKTFLEKNLLLLNRENDPVRIFEHEPAPPHSILKLFLDLFSRKSTADLFYTNDIKVLIDMVVRNISDLSPGDKRRHLYIELCRRIMRNTNYDEHRHKLDDILKCFTRIIYEENAPSENDQKLVREISHEFPRYFK